MQFMIGTYCAGSSGVTERIKILGWTRTLPPLSVADEPREEEEEEEVVVGSEADEVASAPVAEEASDSRLMSGGAERRIASNHDCTPARARGSAKREEEARNRKTERERTTEGHRKGSDKIDA